MVLMVLHIFLQIILEMLPVSSSGNLMLLFYFLKKLHMTELSFTLSNSFNFLLHAPAVIVLGLYFFKPWLEHLIGFFKCKRESLLIVLLCVVADGLTAGFYFLFRALGTDFFPLWIGFLITGFGLLSLRFLSLLSGSSRFPLCSTSFAGQVAQDDREKYAQISQKNRLCNKLKVSHFWEKTLNRRVILSGEKRSVGIQILGKNIFRPALFLGITQGLALLPGISRFGSTYVVGRWLGFSSERAFELSFLIAWPLMVLGTLKGFWQMHQAHALGQLLRVPVLFSILTATVLSWFVLQWVAGLVKREQLWKFCWWVFILAAVAFFIG